MNAGKRILVVYYSLSGNTERVAEDLATRLDADREKIGEATNRRGWLGYVRAALDSIRERHAQLSGLRKNPGDYSLVIVGTPIWAGKITPAIRAYLHAVCGRCNDIAFFTTSGSTPVAKVLPSLERLAGRQPVASTGFSYDDLKTPAQYETKIQRFIDGLQSGRHHEASAQELAHAHA
jgi:hypothetical protein